jgi:opacity protein-like surface antigen
LAAALIALSSINPPPYLHPRWQNPDKERDMKRIISVVFSAGTALAIGAGTANAQVAIGIGGGIAIPIGAFSDANKGAAKTGWHGLAHIGYDLPSGLGLRGDFYYGQHSVKGVPSGLSAKWKLAGGLGNVLYSFTSPGTVHPYILGSVGFMDLKATVSGGGVSVSSSETKITFGGGAGIKFKAGSRASVFVEGRYLTINTSGENANFIPITVGVSFGLK